MEKIEKELKKAKKCKLIIAYIISINTIAIFVDLILFPWIGFDCIKMLFSLLALLLFLLFADEVMDKVIEKYKNQLEEQDND